MFGARFGPPASSMARLCVLGPQARFLGKLVSEKIVPDSNLFRIFLYQISSESVHTTFVTLRLLPASQRPGLSVCEEG